MTPPPPHAVVIHGHFYQPPREDPWTGEVPAQPSAAPFHDWNERIEAECYRPVTSARILGPDGQVERLSNVLERMSFDFGPTLLGWLERHTPETYAAILAADEASCERLDGHGNAMAMAFHHSILPLAEPRDRRTEIRWGIADFRRRFGREPEGMWLPETAVDSATLSDLAAEGIAFTVLAPHQVKSVPVGGRPGMVETDAGELAVFVYDGALSHQIAFGELARDGVAWAETMAARPEGTSLVSTCVDGETFGHHHDFAAMGLAAMLARLETDRRAEIHSYGSYLAAHPPEENVALVEPTAWSCAHGVDRWRAQCGCRADPSTPTSQAWRGPLRAALEWLAEELHRVFEVRAKGVLTDPWAARDAYGDVVGTEAPSALRMFLDAWTPEGSGVVVQDRALRLLEMEHDSLRLFTSCAWFFDDVARVEPLQVLRYAAHAIELADGVGTPMESGFMARLSDAKANDPEDGTAADLFAGLRP